MNQSESFDFVAVFQIKGNLKRSFSDWDFQNKS